MLIPKVSDFQAFYFLYFVSDPTALHFVKNLMGTYFNFSSFCSGKFGNLVMHLAFVSCSVVVNMNYYLEFIYMRPLCVILYVMNP